MKRTKIDVIRELENMLFSLVIRYNNATEREKDKILKEIERLQDKIHRLENSAGKLDEEA